MKPTPFFGIAAIFLSSLVQGSPAGLLQAYRAEGAGPFDAAAGQSAWVREHRAPESPQVRSCASCHGSDLTRPGKHIKTGKVIEPLATSVNPARLADAEEVEKWLRRNCRWTLGRACTPQEKGDFVSYISSQ
jgi:hypothetical protein